MDTHLEIEFKQLLSKDIYDIIKSDHFQQIEPITHTNHYFTDQKGILSKLRYSLRVRQSNKNYEFTLKIPQGFSKLEINEIITQQQFYQLQNHILFESRILEELTKINISIQDLSILTSLTTFRLEKEYQQGVLCIDESFYNGITDYEIEYEAINEESGKEIFNNLLNRYHLNYQGNCPGKFTRAIKTL